MTRRLAAVLLAALTVAGAGATASQAATSAKTEARRLIQPIRAFESETRALRPQARDALGAWQARVTPCVAGAKGDLSAAPNATEENTSLRVLVLYFQALVDGYKQSYAPVQLAVDRAERKWRRMSLRSPRLRLLARWQADGLAVIRKAPISDTCSFYAEWKATGFDPARIPAATNALLESVEKFDSARVERAHRALLRLVGQRLATRFQKFPLAPTLATEDELTAPIDRGLA